MDTTNKDSMIQMTSPAQFTHVLSGQDIADLVERNAARLNAAKAKLGTKYLIHPDNQITKKKYKQYIKQLNKSYT